MCAGNMSPTAVSIRNIVNKCKHVGYVKRKRLYFKTFI